MICAVADRKKDRIIFKCDASSYEEMYSEIMAINLSFIAMISLKDKTDEEIKLSAYALIQSLINAYKDKEFIEKVRYLQKQLDNNE